MTKRAKKTNLDDDLDLYLSQREVVALLNQKLVQLNTVIEQAISLGLAPKFTHAGIGTLDMLVMKKL